MMSVEEARDPGHTGHHILHETEAHTAKSTMRFPAIRSAEVTSLKVKGLSPPIDSSRTRHLNVTLGTVLPSDSGIFGKTTTSLFQRSPARLHYASL
jgi:hypothetical protein